jgi:hypothetical protein
MIGQWSIAELYKSGYNVLIQCSGIEGLKEGKVQDEFHESKQGLVTCSSAYCFVCAFDRYAHRFISWPVQSIVVFIFCFFLILYELHKEKNNELKTC